MAEAPKNKLDPTQTVIVRHKRFQEAYRAIQKCFDSYATRAQPMCEIITGPSGSGKSTIFSIFGKEHPSVDRPRGPERRFLNFPVPPQVTARSLAEQFLIVMKDPYPSRGTVAELGRRIDKALSCDECGHGVRVVALQEAQRLVDSPWIALWDMGNFLRERIETSGCSFVLSGLDYTEDVIDSNEQLQRLFPSTIKLGAFNWIERRERDDFRSILKTLKEDLSGTYKLPLIEEPDLAFRLQYCSYGLIGYLMTIIRGAADLARAHGTDSIGEAFLKESYQRHIRRKDSLKLDPFAKGDFKPENVPPLVLPHAAVSERNAARRRHGRKAPRLSAKTNTGM